jgi:prephenate dehydrogenase
VSEPASWRGDLLVIGTGLVGTSVGLAATRAGARVLLHDVDERRLDRAVALGAGERWPGPDRDAARLVLVAVPPRHTGGVLIDSLQRNLGETISHTCSVQLLPQREIEAAGLLDDRFVGSHPIAGRETSGPDGASPDLFADRTWAVCPTTATGAAAIAAVESLASACGAAPVRLDPQHHDEVLGRVSHLPQLVASALAATIAELAPADSALAGAGLRDSTRLADSDPELWAQIVAANAPVLAAALPTVTAPLEALAAELAGGSPQRAHDAVRALIETGRRGRQLLPGKHGRPAARWSSVLVVIPDQPGGLAAVFAAAAEESINIEDLRLEHAAGHPVGVLELWLRQGEEDRLIAALRERGWTATSGAAGS